MRRYFDVDGNEHERPADAPAQWRIGGYGVVERDDRLLLVETILPSRQRWDLPGGGIHLDPEETILEGIVREVHEETGYRFRPDATTLRLVDDAFFRPPSGRFWRMLTFAARGDVDAEPDPAWMQPRDEIARVAWVDPLELHQDDVLQPHWDLLVKLGYLIGDSK